MTIIQLFHPGARPLQRFTDGDSPSGEHSRIASHLAACVSCRAKVSFGREISRKASSLRAIHPPSELIERVIAERASGHRAILPVANQPHRSGNVVIRRAAAALVIAAGLGALYVGGGLPRTVGPADKHAASRQPPDAASRLGEFLGPLIFLPGTAAAAEPRASVSTFKRAVEFNGSKLQPIHLEYARYWTTASGSRKITGRGSVQLSRIGNNWKIERDWTGSPDDAGKGQVQHETETAFLTGGDLKLISREIHTTPYSRYSRINIEQRFVGERVSGRMTTEGGDSRGVGRPIGQTLPGAKGPFMTDAAVPVLMRTVAVTPGWSGSFSLVGWAVRKEDVLIPVTVRVIGSERISVPAGTFDCWRMTITAENHDLSYWVRKSDGVGVLTRNDSRRVTSGTREIALVSEKANAK